MSRRRDRARRSRARRWHGRAHELHQLQERLAEQLEPEPEPAADAERRRAESYAHGDHVPYGDHAPDG